MTKKVLNVSEVGEGGWGLSLQSRTGNTLEMTITVLFVGPKKHVFFWGQKQPNDRRDPNPPVMAYVLFFSSFFLLLPALSKLILRLL